MMSWLLSLNQIEFIAKYLGLGSGIRALTSRTCPRCGLNDVRSSVRRGIGDCIIAYFGLAPYRCRACRNRFFRFPVGNGNGLQPAAVPLRSARAQPVTSQPVATQAVIAQPLGALPFAKHPLAHIPVAYSLLVVSRDPAIRKLLGKLLAQPGYHTHELADASQLLSELQTRKVDVLVIDLDQPEQQRLETVTALRSTYANLRIIALSGLRVAGVPGAMVLPKPFRRELLLESVQNALVEAADTSLPAAPML